MILEVVNSKHAEVSEKINRTNERVTSLIESMNKLRLPRRTEITELQNRYVKYNIDPCINPIIATSRCCWVNPF